MKSEKREIGKAETGIQPLISSSLIWLSIVGKREFWRNVLFAEVFNRHPRQTQIAEAGGICYVLTMIEPEQLVGEEWAEWYRLTPVERWVESEKLWQTHLALGGSLDPEPDTQSPFFDARAPRPGAADGRPGVRVLRRGRV